MGKKAKPIILIVILALIVGGYYFYLSNKAEPNDEGEIVTAVQEVLLKNLETNYPPTPKEVVKYYSEISECLRNESYTDEQFEQMADRLLALYDDEFLASIEREKYLKDLKSEMESFRENSYTMVNFTTSSSTDVEYYTKVGREMAQLYCIYTFRVDSQYSTTQYRFALRKDVESGHWKILGFEVPTQEE